MERQELISLVTKAQAGDSEAMEALFAAFYGDVYDFARKSVNDEDLACDITQETFLEIIRTIGNLKEPVAFVTWMKKIAYHQCTRYFKKKKDVLVDEDEEGNTIFDTLADESEDAIPAEVYEKEEFRQTIMGMVNTLSGPQRAAVILHYYDGLSISQVAQIQDVSEGTVKSRLNYARKALKVTVEDYEKKHDVKLHSFSFLPLFLLLFAGGKEKMPAEKAAVVRKAVQQAAKQAAKSAAVGAGFGAKLAALPGATKIIACVAAAAIVVGGIAMTVSPKREAGSAPVQQVQQEEPSELPIQTEVEQPVIQQPVVEEPGVYWMDADFLRENLGSATAVYFTDRLVPEGALPLDISYCRDGSVLLWWEDMDAYITTADGRPVIASGSLEGMFRQMEVEDVHIVRENTSLTKVDLSNLDTSRVWNMHGMFDSCVNLTEVNMAGVDTSNVEDFSHMFAFCNHLQTVDVSGFDTSKAQDMTMMFFMCENLQSLDVSGWDTSHVESMHAMFDDCKSLRELDVSDWNTANVWDFSLVFGGCESVAVLDVSGWDTSSAETMEGMFGGCESLTSLDVSRFDTFRVTDMACMFVKCKNVSWLDVSGFDTSRVTDMNAMFYLCESLTAVDVSGFDTSNVTDMGDMFGHTYLETVDVSRFDTAKVTSMYSMFGYNPNLRYVDVSGFDTSGVTNMEGMFVDCNSLQSVDVSSWDTSNVETMSMMFMECHSLTGVDVSNFNTGKVTDTMYMFENCTSLTYVDVSSWDTANLIDPWAMFRDCPNLQVSGLSNWTYADGVTYEDLFT